MKLTEPLNCISTEIQKPSNGPLFVSLGITPNSFQKGHASNLQKPSITVVKFSEKAVLPSPCHPEWPPRSQRIPRLNMREQFVD